MLAVKRTRKFLNLRPSDRFFPFLSLDAKGIKAQSIVADNSVDSFVTDFANRFASVLSRASVVHGNEEVDDQFFKELRSGILDLLKEVVGED
jgi:hypothetical protein